MHRILFLAVLLIAMQSSAFATWSVIAVDRSTGRVVISSATCVNQNDEFLRNVQAVVVPGKGVAACQSSVDNTKENQMLIFRELQKGTEPRLIMEMVAVRDTAFQSRQIGILDLQGRYDGHSGLGNGFVSQDMQGQVPGTEIFYSIQGNILRTGNVVPAAVQAFVKNTGALTDRVMAAMEAADDAGGDSRCTCPTTPAATGPAIACQGKTSHVAYILMAEKTDTNGDSHYNGKYAMYLTVSQPSLPNAQDGTPRDPGPNKIKANENLNPVKTLRLRYDAWRKTQPANFK